MKPMAIESISLSLAQSVLSAAVILLRNNLRLDLCGKSFNMLRFNLPSPYLPLPPAGSLFPAPSSIQREGEVSLDNDINESDDISSIEVFKRKHQLSNKSLCFCCKASIEETLTTNVETP